MIMVLQQAVYTIQNRPDSPKPVSKNQFEYLQENDLLFDLDHFKRPKEVQISIVKKTKFLINLIQISLFQDRD